MRKTLLATTALAAAGAFAAGPVLAADMADKLSIGLGGYMQQWIGGSSVDATDAEGKATAVEGGVGQYSDSEIYFRGRLEADNGLTFSVKVEMEGNTHGDQIDESQATVRGAFGEIQIGSEDHAASLMHYGNKDVGVGLNCGDAGFINGITGCALQGGLGLGTSGWLIGGDDQKISYFTPRMEGVQFGVSYIPNAEGGTGVSEDGGENWKPADNDNDAVAVGLNYMGGIGDVSVALSGGHYVASQTLAEGSSATKIDELTFTNFGLQVGVGAFGFDVAYAVHDGGQYMPHATNPDVMVKNGVADYEVVSVGGKYSDGPMAISLSHMMAEDDAGGDSGVTMLSGSYTLAPGIDWKTSIFGGEQDSGTDKTSVEGAAFVTGITLSF